MQLHSVSMLLSLNEMSNKWTWFSEGKPQMKTLTVTVFVLRFNP
jgi:hypothetical protein